MEQPSGTLIFAIDSPDLGMEQKWRYVSGILDEIFLMMETSLTFYVTMPWSIKSGFFDALKCSLLTIMAFCGFIEVRSVRSNLTKCFRVFSDYIAFICTI